jgi:hypothetical protein
MEVISHLLDAFQTPLLLLLVFILLLKFVRIGTPPNCPKCGEQQKVPRRPSSFHQAMWGGWDCHSCGCKMDGRGNEVKS